MTKSNTLCTIEFMLGNGKIISVYTYDLVLRILRVSESILNERNETLASNLYYKKMNGIYEHQQKHGPCIYKDSSVQMQRLGLWTKQNTKDLRNDLWLPITEPTCRSSNNGVLGNALANASLIRVRTKSAYKHNSLGCSRMPVISRNSCYMFGTEYYVPVLSTVTDKGNIPTHIYIYIMSYM